MKGGKIMQSKSGTLNTQDWKNWVKSAFEWLAPLGVIYFGAVLLKLQSGFSVEAFAVTPTILGAISLYIIDQLYGLSKRWQAGKASA